MTIVSFLVTEEMTARLHSQGSLEGLPPSLPPSSKGLLASTLGTLSRPPVPLFFLFSEVPFKFKHQKKELVFVTPLVWDCKPAFGFQGRDPCIAAQHRRGGGVRAPSWQESGGIASGEYPPISKRGIAGFLQKRKVVLRKGFVRCHVFDGKAHHGSGSIRKCCLCTGAGG